MPSVRWRTTAVICRAEGRADERPLRFEWRGEWLEVERIESAWLEQGPEEGAPTFRVFLVQTCNGSFRLRISEPGFLWQALPISIAPGSDKVV